MMPNRVKESFISQEDLLKNFRYIPETGCLERTSKPTNQHKKTGGIDRSGHVVIQIKRKFYYAHRLIFLYHHGYMPEQIDHINRIKTDNRIENLRECTARENSFNRKKSESKSRFSSKYRGVSWESCKTPSSNHWKAYICYKYKVYHIGYFKEEIEASKERDLEVVRRGFDTFMHLNHPDLLENYKSICSKETCKNLA